MIGILIISKYKKITSYSHMNVQINIIDIAKICKIIIKEEFNFLKIFKEINLPAAMIG